MAQAAAEHVRSRRPELFGSSADPAADTIPAVSTKSTVPTVPTVSTKSTETDPVTVADTETEHLIRSLLRTARPDDEVLGEEAGGSVDVPSGVRWVVDPSTAR